MTPRDPGEFRIRNQRCRRAFDLLGAMLVVCVFAGLLGLFILPRRFDRIMLLVILGSVSAMVPIALYGFFQIWDLRRPVPSRPVTARILFDWLVLGIRRQELGPADGWTALTAGTPA